MSRVSLCRRGRRSRRVPRRMAPLATLPLFFKLDGKRVVVAGGSEAAAWKAELLSAAGATVEVWAADPCARDGGAGRRRRPAVASSCSAESWSRSRFRRRRAGGRRCRGRGRGASHVRGRAAGGCARQRHRQAGVLQLPVRRRGQPLAAGRGHLNRRRGAGIRPGHPLAHRGAAARGLRALGRGRQGVARASCKLCEPAPPCGGGSGSGLPRWRCARPSARRARDRDELLAKARNGSCEAPARRATSRSSAPAPATRSCSRSPPYARCARPTSSSTTTSSRPRCSTSPAARPSACWWARPAIALRAGRTTSTR